MKLVVCNRASLSCPQSCQHKSVHSPTSLDHGGGNMLECDLKVSICSALSGMSKDCLCVKPDVQRVETKERKLSIVISEEITEDEDIEDDE